MIKPLLVTSEEAEQKLLQFLLRRFEVPHSMLHRWIRTGQVRVNGKRTTPFQRVHQGDAIRIPPFAGCATAQDDVPEKSAASASGSPGLPPVIAETEEILLFCKPAGLPVHPGTGHQDSLTTRLETVYAGAAFMPTPVHRLDRATSGLLIVAKTYTALRRLADSLAQRDGGIVKEYLAWVKGIPPWSTPYTLEDLIEKHRAGNKEKMVVAGSSTQAHSPQLKQAKLTALRLYVREQTSLVSIRLHTGRTHQIRVQLAAQGFPLVGDTKYGGPACESGLKLHAARLCLSGKTYFSRPSWEGRWAVDEEAFNVFSHCRY